MDVMTWLYSTVSKASLLSLQIIVMLLLSICCCGCSSSDTKSNLLQALNMLRHRDDRSSMLFERSPRSMQADLREHRIFHSDPKLDCCPTVSELSERTVGINPQGLVLELFHNSNFTQTFYETLCHPRIKDDHCQFIDPALGALSRCVQQYSYVYAMSRTFGKWNEQYRIDYIRVAAGCKCTLVPPPPPPPPLQSQSQRHRGGAAAAAAGGGGGGGGGPAASAAGGAPPRHHQLHRDTATHRHRGRDDDDEEEDYISNDIDDQY